MRSHPCICFPLSAPHNHSQCLTHLINPESRTPCLYIRGVGGWGGSNKYRLIQRECNAITPRSLWPLRPEIARAGQRWEIYGALSPHLPPGWERVPGKGLGLSLGRRSLKPVGPLCFSPPRRCILQNAVCANFFKGKFALPLRCHSMNNSVSIYLSGFYLCET